MAYAFKQKQSIAHNINRILGKQLKASLSALENPGEATGESIHSIRKRIKKVRAVFRLVRSELKEKDFQREDSRYRAIGNALSPLRDATVMVKTLDKLQEAQPALMDTQLVDALRQDLVHQQDRATHEFFQEKNNRPKIAKALEQAAKKRAGLSGKHNGFGVMAPNLKHIYRQARKALKRASHEPSIEHLHTLRKKVKTLWYHTRLLQPIWPGLFQAYEHEFGRLGELLGDDHDFGVFAQAIESGQLLLPNKQAKEALLQLLQQQRDQLQAQIYPLANRLLSEKAGGFVNKFRLSWKVWRAEAKHKPIDQLQTA